MRKKGMFVSVMIVVVGLLLFGLGSATNDVKADINDGLVAYYPFNGNANDESGNGNDGTLVNGPALCDDRFGNPDSAYCFDGYDDYIDIADAPELNPTSEVTVAAWFNLKTSHGNYWPPLARKADSVFGYELTMNGGPHSGVVYPGIQFDTVLDVDGFVVTDPATPITLNAWQCAVGVLDGSDVKLYLNGELKETDSATGNIIPTSHNLMIGGDPNPAIFGRFFDGAIDEVRIYNRALSESEIQELCRGVVPINVDIKPGSCPNPFKLKCKGCISVLPAAVLGTDELDVSTINPDTIMITREGIEGGVPLFRHSYEDVATPFEGELCDCHELYGDGYMDLTLKFMVSELIDGLKLYEFEDRETIPLTIVGETYDGTPIRGEDCIRIIGYLNKPCNAELD